MQEALCDGLITQVVADIFNLRIKNLRNHIV